MDIQTVSMDTKGIMAQIRQLLAEGKSSSEIIALGYKPYTVYKVQRGLNRKRQGNGTPQAQMMDRVSGVVSSTDPQSELEAENVQLRWQVKDLNDARDEAYFSHLELSKARGRIHELEAEAAAELRQRVRDLEGQLEHAAHTQVAMRQAGIQWRQKFEAEQAARSEAGRKLAVYNRGLLILP